MNILVGFSGGLDSMMTAHLLKQAGHTVTGAVVLMHGHTDISGAEYAASALGIPLCVTDYTETFEREVIGNFTDEYAAARTPNPCIRCNRYVKITGLYDYALTHGFDGFATGHYARVQKVADRYAIAQAADPKKDQSYVLWGLSQAQLAIYHTPLADYRKEDLRQMARELGFATADKPESQDICFLPQGDYAAFVSARVGAPTSGEFVTADGKVVGTHKGLLHYTIGQRKGLGIALGEPVFVTKLDPKTNRITVAPARDLATAELTAIQPVYSGMAEPAAPVTRTCMVKIRYNAAPVPTVATFDKDGVTAQFSPPIRALATPGQSAVFYDTQGYILCGAIIA